MADAVTKTQLHCASSQVLLTSFTGSVTQRDVCVEALRARGTLQAYEQKVNTNMPKSTQATHIDREKQNALLKSGYKGDGVLHHQLVNEKADCPVEQHVCLTYSHISS